MSSDTKKLDALPVQAEHLLFRVELMLEQALDFPNPGIDACLSSMVINRGKLLRPTLCLLTGLMVSEGKLTKETESRLIKLATAIEILHIASLLHDDIIDRSPIRRNMPAAHMQWDEAVATMAGDIAFARSIQILSSLGGDIHIGAIKLVCNLVSGEIRQFKTLYNPMKTLREYLVILRGKTASMFSFCCWGATIVSGASDTKITNQMKRFGRQFGLAFQIADDIHDREPFNNSIELSSKIGNYYKKSSR